MNPVLIINEDSGRVWTSSSGKTSWREVGHAKNAWAQTTGNKFDEQSDYEILFLDAILKELIEMRAFRKNTIEENADEFYSPY